MRIIIALLCSAVAFPAMLFERPLPLPPPASAIAWQQGRSWFHNMKNLSSESLRADCQWWSKALCFAVLVAMVGAVSGVVMLLAAGGA